MVRTAMPGPPAGRKEAARYRETPQGSGSVVSRELHALYLAPDPPLCCQRGDSATACPSPCAMGTGKKWGLRLGQACLLLGQGPPVPWAPSCQGLCPGWPGHCHQQGPHSEPSATGPHCHTRPTTTVTPHTCSSHMQLTDCRGNAEECKGNFKACMSTLFENETKTPPVPVVRKLQTYQA